jgi:hypothetical protein
MTEGRYERPVPRAARYLLLADLDGALYQLSSITFTPTAFRGVSVCRAGAVGQCRAFQSDGKRL